MVLLPKSYYIPWGAKSTSIFRSVNCMCVKAEQQQQIKKQEQQAAAQQEECAQLCT